MVHEFQSVRRGKINWGFSHVLRLANMYKDNLPDQMMGLSKEATFKFIAVNERELQASLLTNYVLVKPTAMFCNGRAAVAHG